MSATRVFISYSWQDKELARDVGAALKAAGNQVWIDYDDTRGGDNLTERISAALDWCDTLVLIWTDSAKQSEWVKLEWTSAVALRKRIVPCVIGTAKLPAILASTLYVEMADSNTWLARLKQSISRDRFITEVISSHDERVDMFDSAIRDGVDMAESLERGRSTTIESEPEPSAQVEHSADGLDSLVGSVQQMIDKRGREGQIGSGDSIYGSASVRNSIAHLTETEKLQVISRILNLFNEQKTYQGRLPLALILFGMLESERELAHASTYEPSGREKWVKYLHDMGVPEVAPFQEIVDTMSAAYSDCWV